jgi:hypothetical protein
VRRRSAARAVRIRTWSLGAAQEVGRGIHLRIDIDAPQNMEVAWKAQKLVVSKAGETRSGYTIIGCYFESLYLWMS